MPQIRIMNWNIRQMSWNKLGVGSHAMTANLAQVIAAANVDVVIILEVAMYGVLAAMNGLSSVLRGGGGGNLWSGFLISHPTGGEHYGVLIRNFNVVRPVFPIAGPRGTAFDPLTNLERNDFGIWPSPDWTQNAYPLPEPQGPMIPLVDLYATSPPAGRLPSQFRGQPFANAGYSEGRGFRLPAMPIFVVQGQNRSYYLPVVVCHYAAVRSSTQLNNLAQAQVVQLQYLGIAQMFAPAPPQPCGCLAVETAPGAVTAVPVQEILFTGDFNLDFLQNQATGTFLQKRNRIAFNALTPTQSRGGSADPPPPGALPAAIPQPLPAVPYTAFTPPRQESEIGPQALHAAVTAQGTILGIPPPPPPLPMPASYVAGALDNFFYGGAQLNTAQAQYGPGGIDAGEAVNVPGMVFGRQLDVSAAAAAYQAAGGTYGTGFAPALQNPLLAMDAYQAAIGANLLSDHLPVILQFDCP